MFSFHNKFNVIKCWPQGISVRNTKPTLLYIVPFDLKKKNDQLTCYCKMGIEVYHDAWTDFNF